MTLNVAIGYGGQQEIIKATNEFIQKNPGKPISSQELTKHTYLDNQPPPDLIIRTSGEHRHSGFLLWHSAYSEYFFSNTFWPSFSRVDFLSALGDYQKRNRRFGK
jgi:short-chain Z-isoprenyl diphosphate synthase